MLWILKAIIALIWIIPALAIIADPKIEAIPDKKYDLRGILMLSLLFAVWIAVMVDAFVLFPHGKLLVLVLAGICHWMLGFAANAIVERKAFKEMLDLVHPRELME